MEPENSNTTELILQNRNGFTDIENTHGYQRGKRGKINWEFGMNRYTLLYIE